MQISLQSSKKCLTADASAFYLIALATFLFCASAHGSVPKPRGSSLQHLLQKEIRNRPSNNFDSLLKKWESTYSTAAVQPLLSIAADRKLSDPDRYIAVMGAAKLGGTATAVPIIPLLKDPSWMIRNAALRALTALRDPVTAPAILPLLRDPALVVRVEAVTAVETLRPLGATEALLETLQNRANYHGGKAQWVPQHALQALVKLRAKNVAPKLAPLLNYDSDSKFQHLTINALETLTGENRAPGRPLAEKVREWKRVLAKQ
ncbi:MAG: hypothetical protein A2428_05440 [Bdellovibrionales bacterium RIFOXYC1_FULL_54_43]|nr:MAG: hypothetical protein A2428_05440 [Bdellovibrionales bacterium RIFOXYC1_FULL_54_43]OFZ82800.1 MAG: hypothetical protein A2603_05040 [Bdellovibrionales bacterium RIFOXYD1_FULL_55_31]